MSESKEQRCIHGLIVGDNSRLIDAGIVALTDAAECSCCRQIFSVAGTTMEISGDHYYSRIWKPDDLCEHCGGSWREEGRSIFDVSEGSPGTDEG